MGFDNVNVNVSGPVQPTSTYKTKVLKGNLSFALQVTEPNTKYVIKHNFVLDADVTIPENCVLEFGGGSIGGAYTLTGQNTGIKAGLVKIFSTSVTIDGSWNVTEAYPEWFGAVRCTGNNIVDSTNAIQKCLDVFFVTKLSGGQTDPQSSYYITTVYVRPYQRTVQRSLIIEGSVIVMDDGNGIWVGSYCSLIGTGRFARIAGVSGSGNGAIACVTIGVNDSQNITCRNVIVLNIYCYRATYGIHCKPREGTGDVYNAFCSIKNISIYGCIYGIYGNIRSSVIDYTVNGTKGNLYLTQGDFNDITITGNASNISDIQDPTPFEAFIHIQGSRNHVRAYVYDIGATGMQKRLVDFDGIYNTINENGSRIRSSETTNTQTRFNYADGIYTIDAPRYTVSYVNINIATSYHKPALEHILFKRNCLRNYISIDKDDYTQPAYVEFQFGSVSGFIGLHFVFNSSNFTFSKIEVFANATDETPIATVTSKGASAEMGVYADNLYAYSPENFASFSNLTVRCHVKGSTRINGARFLAMLQKSDLSNYGGISELPTDYNIVKNGDEYILDTGTGLIPLWAKLTGTYHNIVKWYKADGTEYTGE